MIIYIRVVNDYQFLCKSCSSISVALRIAFQDLSEKIAIPYGILDEKCNVLYNRKEIIREYNNERSKVNKNGGKNNI